MRRWALGLSLLALPAFVRPRLSRVARRAADDAGLALWLLEQGAQVNSAAAVQSSATGRGIWSTQPLEQGAEVARIPYKLLLTQASAEKALPELQGVAEYPSIALQLIHEPLGMQNQARMAFSPCRNG